MEICNHLVSPLFAFSQKNHSNIITNKILPIKKTGNHNIGIFRMNLV